MTKDIQFDPVDPIGSAFAPLIGLPAWAVDKGQGSFLTFQFGEPHLAIREPITDVSSSVSERIARLLRRRRVVPHGEWFFWIYCCHWRCFEAEIEIATDEATDAEFVQAAKSLDGQRLVAVEMAKAEKGSRFFFDLGGRLETWPYEEDNDDQWLLYAPSGFVLTYRADGRYSWAPGGEDEADHIWRDL